MMTLKLNWIGNEQSLRVGFGPTFKRCEAKRNKDERPENLGKFPSKDRRKGRNEEEKLC